MVSRHVNQSELVATLYDMPFVNELTEVCEAVAGTHWAGGSGTDPATGGSNNIFDHMLDPAILVL